VPSVIATFERRFSMRASLGLQMLGGVSVPRPVIWFADRQVAHWGRPLIGASLALTLGLD
jgi:hypothetical protein